MRSLKSAHFKGPARVDLIEGLTGLFLVAFMWVHMLLVSSILLGKDAMYAVSRFFEGAYFLDRPQPALVSLAALFIFIVMLIHALVALRRLPAGYTDYRALLSHVRSFRHPETNLWLLQVVTGIVLMFLAGAHLYAMFSQPDAIGPYASSDRFVSGGMWPLYLILLIAVELHAGIGLYRLVLKWGLWPMGQDPVSARRQLQKLKWGLTAFFLILGLATFAAYVKIGIEHRDFAGERYRPDTSVEVTH